VSTGYGIAAVTAVLKARLENRLLDADVQAAIGPASVTALPPDTVQAGAAEPNQLNIFLHHATPSAAWRNEGHPIRSGNGQRIARPPLALDLNYLVTAFGVDTYAAEILLGEAMAELHEHPLLDSASVDHVLHPAAPDATLPAAVSASGLENQPEPVRIVPIAVNSEEMSRLWTSLQGKYRATAAYLVGSVLIDPSESAATGLPVLQRNLGPETLTAMRISDVVVEPAAEGPVDPVAPILPTSRILVRGRGLAAADAVLVSGEALAVATVRADGVVADLATATQLRPGPVAVAVAAGELSRSSSVITGVRPVATFARVATTVTSTVTPVVGRNQRVALLLNELPGPAVTSPRSFVLDAPPGNGAVGNTTTSNSIPFSIAAIPAGTYLTRLEVDGVASLLGVNAQGVFSTPTVTRP
jgi:Pvc16 N-terminal domain